MSCEQIAENIKKKFNKKLQETLDNIPGPTKVSMKMNTRKDDGLVDIDIKTCPKYFSLTKSNCINGELRINIENEAINYFKNPSGKLAQWDYVMFEPWHWPCMNEWEYHAMVLLEFLTYHDSNVNCRTKKILPQLINCQGGRHLWGKGEQAGMTALHYATEQGFPDVVDKLLSIPGIDVNIRDFSGRTPLHLSFIRRNSDRIIISLIKHGADFTIQDEKGGTPFLNAMLFLGDDWLVHMIFDHLVNYDIHQQDDKGFDLLRWAVECNCPLLVRKIMSRGGKPEVVDKKGCNTIKASKLSYNEEIQKIFD